MAELTESLPREITIRARRETVFAYFTDSERFARWWGPGSRIDPRPGGAVEICYPNGVQARGEILEIEPPRCVVFSYGYGGNPAEFSIVTIILDTAPDGTRLRLTHAFSSRKIRDQFVQGWRYQLALFSKAVSDEQHGNATERVDAFLAAWGDPDPEARRRLLESSADPEVSCRDAYTATEGLEDLLANLEAIQLHMPGLRLAREGDIRLCHGAALARWTANRSDGGIAGRGMSFYDLSADGRIARVTAFWEP